MDLDQIERDLAEAIDLAVRMVRRRPAMRVLMAGQIDSSIRTLESMLGKNDKDARTITDNLARCVGGMLILWRCAREDGNE